MNIPKFTLQCIKPYNNSNHYKVIYQFRANKLSKYNILF